MEILLMSVDIALVVFILKKIDKTEERLTKLELLFKQLIEERNHGI
jgi:hypothetical protein